MLIWLHSSKDNSDKLHQIQMSQTGEDICNAYNAQRVDIFYKKFSIIIPV